MDIWILMRTFNGGLKGFSYCCYTDSLCSWEVHNRFKIVKVVFFIAGLLKQLWPDQQCWVQLNRHTDCIADIEFHTLKSQHLWTFIWIALKCVGVFIVNTPYIASHKLSNKFPNVLHYETLCGYLSAEKCLSCTESTGKCMWNGCTYLLMWSNGLPRMRGHMM